MIIKRFVTAALIGIIIAFSLVVYVVADRGAALLGKSAEEKASLFAESIASSIKHSMTEGVPEIARSIVGDLNRKGPMKIAVFKANGDFVFGNADVSVSPSALRISEDTVLRQNGSLLFLSPLLNESACHRCHSSREKVLGVTAFVLPEGAVTNDLRNAETSFVVLGILLVLSAAVAVFIVAKKCLLDPLMRIHRGVETMKGGDLGQRIDLPEGDEFGTLATAFNEMAENIQRSHANLENEVRKKTTELRVVAELSSSVFREDVGLGATVEEFLSALVDKMGFGVAALGLVDSDNGVISCGYQKGSSAFLQDTTVSIASSHPLAQAVREARPITAKPPGVDFPVVMIPVISHRRKRCREVNLCSHETCPAFAGIDDRCWLTSGTLCRSPQAVAGANKIYGCLHCAAFPVLAVLAVGSRGEEMSRSSLDSLTIVASTVSSVIEMQRAMESRREDIHNLIRLHDVSAQSLQNPSGTLAHSIVTSVFAFSAIDAAVLWTRADDGRHRVEEVSGLDKGLLPEYLPEDDPLVGKAVKEGRIEEAMAPCDTAGLGGLLSSGVFTYTAAIPLQFRDLKFGCISLFKKKDFSLTESEKAILTLFATQAAAAINTNRIYGELAMEKDFSDVVFNNMSVGIMVLDDAGRIVKMNPAGLGILRAAPSCIGRDIREVLPGANRFLDLAEPGLNREIEMATGGADLCVGFENSAIVDASHARTGTIVVFRDLTEIKRLQSALRHKEHYEAMGKVISGVAHEVRNPLFGISSIGQILARELESPQHKALTQAMLKETDRMKRLIEELLMYTRPSRLVIRDIDLRALIGEISHFAKAKKENVELVIDIPDAITVRADRDKLTQVFLNLLNNAVDAAVSSITIAARRRDGTSEMRFTDDGPGIRQQDLDRVFEPFFTTKKGGTGLGLPICKKIVEDHGGTIDVLSTAGKGTTVVLSFKA